MLISFLNLFLSFIFASSDGSLTNPKTFIRQSVKPTTIIAQTSEINAQFTTLKRELEAAGFEVILALPPQRGAYGLLEVTTKKIWINPVVFDLNIALPTIIHESVHAAQVCAGNGQITSLALAIEPINHARPFFQRYHDIYRQDLEREAYAVQTQPNRFELALSLLKKHCSY